MSIPEFLFFAGLFILILFISVTSMLALIVAVIPRDHTRQLRRKLSDFVFWQWVTSSWLSSRLHKWLWDSDKNGSRH